MEPIRSSIEIDGIRVASVGVNWCEGDFNGDNDVDGSDLNAYTTEPEMPSFQIFADNFGRINCP